LPSAREETDPDQNILTASRRGTRVVLAASGVQKGDLEAASLIGGGSSHGIGKPHWEEALLAYPWGHTAMEGGIMVVLKANSTV
jgi:hypothetical protein